MEKAAGEETEKNESGDNSQEGGEIKSEQRNANITWICPCSTCEMMEDAASHFCRGNSECITKSAALDEAEMEKSSFDFALIQNWAKGRRRFWPRNVAEKGARKFNE